MRKRKVFKKSLFLPNRHDDYVHPRIIFEPNTTLMAVNEDSVLFCETDGVDVHSHDVGPFFYINQFNHVQRLIRIPIHHFVSLMKSEGAERVKEEELNLILLSNVGRCGSTVLTQMFEKLPNTVSISEPECLMPFAADPEMFASKDKGKDGSSKLDPNIASLTRGEILKACILALICSSNAEEDGEKKTNIVIKPKAHAMAITTELDEIFKGRMRHLFLYRHPAQYVTSVSTVFNSLMHPVVRTAVMRFSIRMNMEAFVLTHFPDHTTRRARALASLMEKVDMTKSTYRFACMFCANVMSMVEHREKSGLDFKLLSYHELIEDPGAVMAEVSRFCGLTEDEEEVAEVALPENDSQNNSGLSRQHLNNFKKSLDDAKIKEIDHVLNFFRFPNCETFPIDSKSFEKMLELI